MLQLWSISYKILPHPQTSHVWSPDPRLAPPPTARPQNAAPGLGCLKLIKPRLLRRRLQRARCEASSRQAPRVEAAEELDTTSHPRSIRHALKGCCEISFESQGPLARVTKAPQGPLGQRAPRQRLICCSRLAGLFLSDLLNLFGIFWILIFLPAPSLLNV